MHTQPTAAPPEPAQPGEAVELVSGSGVYILAYRLEEARREAKTGTQLARKLMDCFWDKDTLAKSTLTPRSKFQYQQLDPKIIKAIEGMNQRVMHTHPPSLDPYRPPTAAAGRRRSGKPIASSIKSMSIYRPLNSRPLRHGMYMYMQLR